jgi:signal transduction histidine kinase
MNKLLPTKISLKFILAVFAIIAVFFTVTSVILPHFIKNAIYKSNKKLLSDIAERLSEMPYTSVPDLILHIGNPEKYNTDFRVIYVGKSGVVAYDTSSGDNRYGDMFITKEAQLALSGKKVFYATFSENVFTFNILVPKYGDNGEINGFVYLQNINEGLGRDYLQNKTALHLISAVLCVLLLILGVFISFGLDAKVRTIIQGIKKIKSGEYESRIEIKGEDEFALLGNELNELSIVHSKTEEMRRRFVSDASHELRTPLASIKLLSDSILQNPDMKQENIREFLADISNEIDRLTRISGKLLQITRYDDLKGETSLSPLDLEPIINKVCRMLKPFAKEANCNIRCALESGCIVNANYDLIYQIFYNLIENAIKYGGNNRNVHVYLYKREGQAVAIVDDEGAGIPEEDLKKIFDRFYRVDKARARATGGTGLGLSIVESAVHHCNGTVEAQNRENGGARFIVKFPLHVSENDKK